MAGNDLRYKTLVDLARILSLFEIPDEEERSVSNISKSLQMLPSKVSRMLKTLEADGLFEKNPKTGKYRLGGRLLQLGLFYTLNHPLRRIILPHLEHMAKELGLLVSWAIFKNDRVIIIDRLNSNNVPHLIGLDTSLPSSSYGKLFLAYLSPEEQEHVIKTLTLVRFTPSTKIELEAIREDLKLVKQRGYAIDNEEVQKGIWGITAPVFDCHQDHVAAVTIVAKTSNFDKDRLPEIITYLTEKTSFISRQLGYVTME
jgi:IclR family transcriptional regulator, KDG regulon repressor